MLVRNLMVVIALCSFFFSSTTPISAADLASRSVAEKFIKEMEAAWADQSVSNDDELLRRILADDYIGVSSSSKVVHKVDQVAEAIAAQKMPSDFLYNNVDYVDVHFFSDELAVAQGRETWKLRNGEQGQYIWVDTWLKRKGRWQIIASQDTKTPLTQ